MERRIVANVKPRGGDSNDRTCPPIRKQPLVVLVQRPQEIHVDVLLVRPIAPADALQTMFGRIVQVNDHDRRYRPLGKRPIDPLIQFLLAVVQQGAVIDTAAINVGARLIALSDKGEVVRLEDAAKLIAQDIGFDLELGLKLGDKEKARMVEALASSLLEVILRKKPSVLTQKLMITTPLSFAGKIDSVIFSGGVSE